jgi:KDO2-lipid IV(A) lauroyltransferase
MMETMLCYILKGFGVCIRLLPMGAALWVGRLIGTVVYYVDIRHKRIVYGNLKVAFAKSRGPDELKKITKTFFKNYGQNLVEFFRLPLMTREKFDHSIRMDGREHITEALKKNKGLILLAMHFGSWESAILLCAMLGYPYKVIVNPQKRYTKLDELLNSYRSCGGNIVLSRGLGTRDMVKSLQKNEIIGLVVDQGGRDGVLVPFFERQASMSVGGTAWVCRSMSTMADDR